MKKSVPKRLMPLLKFTLCCLAVSALASYSEEKSSLPSPSPQAAKLTAARPRYDCREALGKRLIQNALENCQQALQESTDRPIC
jgi:hypothetical protein